MGGSSKSSRTAVIWPCEPEAVLRSQYTTSQLPPGLMPSKADRGALGRTVRSKAGAAVLSAPCPAPLTTGAAAASSSSRMSRLLTPPVVLAPSTSVWMTWVPSDCTGERSWKRSCWRSVMLTVRPTSRSRTSKVSVTLNWNALAELHCCVTLRVKPAGVVKVPAWAGAPRHSTASASVQPAAIHWSVLEKSVFIPDTLSRSGRQGASRPPSVTERGEMRRNRPLALFWSNFSRIWR